MYTKFSTSTAVHSAQLLISCTKFSTQPQESSRTDCRTCCGVWHLAVSVHWVEEVTCKFTVALEKWASKYLFIFRPCKWVQTMCLAIGKIYMQKIQSNHTFWQIYEHLEFDSGPARYWFWLGPRALAPDLKSVRRKLHILQWEKQIPYPVASNLFSFIFFLCEVVVANSC